MFLPSYPWLMKAPMAFVAPTPMPGLTGSCLDVHQRDQPSMAAYAQGGSSDRGGTGAHPRAGGKKCEAPGMHNIAAGWKFNVPLGGINLHFYKLLQSGVIHFAPLFKGLIPGAE
jgi:hypothetical protein